MTGIKKVVLKNIRSHLDTVVEFDPHFNVVAGESDEGKSALFWAIYWVCFNPSWNPRPWKRLKPKGESRAELHFFDGNVVARVMDKGKHFYELNGEKLSGLHKKVPEQVQAVLQITDANIQAQKDMFFLLNETSGKVARAINKTANLEVMDRAINMAISRVKATTKTIAGLEDIATDWAAEIKEQQPILDVDTALSVLQVREQNQINQKRKISDTRISLDRIAELREELNQLPSDDCVLDITQLHEIAKDQLKLKSRIEDCETTTTRIKQSRQELVEYGGLEIAADIMQAYAVADQQSRDRKQYIQVIESALQQYRTARENVDSTISAECIQKFDALALRVAELQAEGERVKVIEEVLNNITDINSDIENLQDGIDIEQEELDELRGEIEICPTCLTNLSG